MRYLILVLLLLLFITNDAFAHPPEKVYSIRRQNLSAAHYVEQARLWKQELEANAQNHTAWFNYFMAHQVLFEKGKIDQADLETVQMALEKAIPQSFEAYFARHAVSGDVEALRQAYDLAPERYETYADLIWHYTETFNTKQVRQLCAQWLASGEYSNGFLHWNYNALIGLEERAILLTQGDNYTLPLWLLQYGKNLRTDVQVLSLELLQEPAYRKKVFEQLGWPALLSNEAPDIVRHLSQHCRSRALYFGVSVSKNITQDYQEDLYIMGLAFRHSTQGLDNLQELAVIYEQLFLLDYLKTDLQHDPSEALVQKANVNYLPAFLLLYDYYQTQNNPNEANKIKRLSLKIADAAEKGTEARAYLNQRFNTGDSKTTVKLSYKTIEARYKSLPYRINLYASEIEVTNEDYELFLTDLLKRKAYDLLQQHKIYETDWRSYLPLKFQNAADEVVYPHGHPEGAKMPIRSIEYESALAYCEWLTQVYNQQDHPKKKFKKVRFRLPTAAEWEEAACGHLPNSFPSQNQLYPWRGLGVTNALGCFLVNINTNEVPESTKADPKDGSFFPVVANAYFPNDYGLYNVIGNVAEMVQERGQAKGGSWYHTADESTIPSVQNYSEPQPYIGFRVFMEVLEENAQEKIKKTVIGPPNTIQLKDALYMDKSEITNIDWKEYVYWIKTHEPERYAEVLPDTLVWNAISKNPTPMANHYYQHSAYNSYPVVGISHAQAVAYCQWRSDRVNEIGDLNPSFFKKFRKVRYRLPTETEWEFAANGGLDLETHPYGVPALKNSKGLVVANFRSPSNPKEDLSFTAPTASYPPNGKGFYNMLGNVAEMVQEQGQAKGGSWHHAAHESKIKSCIPYDRPQAWLGFRCICEVGAPATSR